MMRLDEKVLKTFCVAKSFKENDGGKVNSIHFSWDGLGLITSSEDDQIIIYDCERGSTLQNMYLSELELRR